MKLFAVIQCVMIIISDDKQQYYGDFVSMGQYNDSRSDSGGRTTTWRAPYVHALQIFSVTLSSRIVRDMCTCSYIRQAINIR